MKTNENIDMLMANVEELNNEMYIEIVTYLQTITMQNNFIIGIMSFYLAVSIFHLISVTWGKTNV